MDQSKIGRFIAHRRKELELTQAQLAEKLGVSDKSVSKWERGICLPDVALYQELCKILGITINEFFAGEELEKTAVETKSEETIMSIAQDGSNTKKKMKTRILVLGIITAILAACVIYTVSVLNQKGYFLRNYIRSYESSADAKSIKELIAEPNSFVWLTQYGIDSSFEKCTVVVNKYRKGKLVSSEDVSSINYSTYADSRNRTGIAAVVFNTDKNEYRVAVSDGIGMSSFSGMSITGEDEPIPEDWVSGGGPIRDEPVKVTKGEAVPIATCEMGPMEYSTFHDPWELEEDYEDGDVETEFAIVVKLRFD